MIVLDSLKYKIGINMFKDESVKKSIYVSLVVGIILVLFIEPIMHLLLRLISNTSIKMYSSYIDSVYKNAAIGTDNPTGIFFYSIFIIITFQITVLVISKARSVVKKQKNSSKQLITKENILNEHKKDIKKLNIVSIIMIVLMPIYLFFSVISIFNEYSNYKLNATFNQYVNIIAPYVDENEIKTLKSSWALMDSKDDYLLIESNINTIADKNKIILPDKKVNHRFIHE